MKDSAMKRLLESVRRLVEIAMDSEDKAYTDWLLEQVDDLLKTAIEHEDLVRASI